MCGPIALMFSSLNKQRSRAAVLYNLGRTFTYSVLGIISGLLGSAIFIGGGQQALSITGGIIILLALILTFVNLPILRKLQDPVQKFVRTRLGNLLRRKSTLASFGIGVFNGLLPCGLVYAALGGAAATGGFHHGALYMAIFGFATFPVMLTLSILGTKLSPVLHRRLNKLIPYTIAFMAVLLIIRGANLGIPYLSPKMEKQEVVCCHK